MRSVVRRLVWRRQIGAILLFVVPGMAWGQSAEQTFRVRVPQRLTISPGQDSATIEHDQTNGVQRFGAQRFDVVSHSAVGAVVTFETLNAFTHTADARSQRDVRLHLQQPTSNHWWVINNQDQTDYAGGRQVASVSAESIRAGDASFQLQVEFIEQDFARTIAGEYQVTVIATITPK